MSDAQSTGLLSNAGSAVTAWEAWEPSARDPFDHRHAVHLLRRATFGGSSGDADLLVNLGPSQAVESLFSATNSSAFDLEADAMIRTSLILGDVNSLTNWWLYRMLNDPYGVREKATFMWHGHFCTSHEKVADAQLLLDQNNTLRKNALGSFKTLVKLISRDAAMLVYLDSTENRKNRPNENYARELLELFCLGIGNYTEHDIKELARCFTGWEVRRRRFRISLSDHDSGTKSFLDATGDFDGDEAIDVVLSQPASSHFIAKKLISYYVTESPVDDAVVANLAERILDFDWHIEPILKLIFRSRAFFSNQAAASKIASPVEWTISWARALELNLDMNQLANSVRQMGQLPLAPPNVKGWPGGESWVDPSRMISRINWCQSLVDSQLQPTGGLSGWLTRQNIADDKQILKWIEQNLLATPLAVSREKMLMDHVRLQPNLVEQFREGLRATGLLPESHLI